MVTALGARFKMRVEGRRFAFEAHSLTPGVEHPAEGLGGDQSKVEAR